MTDPGGPDPDPGPPPSVAALAATFGLDPAGAEVVRAASRHVVRFPAAGIRTFATPAPADGARAEATVADLLAAAGVPAARRRAGPAPVTGWSVTAWREVPGVDPDAEVGAEVLGDLARALHRATGALDPRGLGRCDPVAAARAQLDLAVPGEEVEVLRAAADRLEPAWRAAVGRAEGGADAEHPEQGGAVVHGDLHRGNVVVGTTGPVLVDLELAGWGPRAYDAAPTAAFVRWYDRPEADLEAFDAAYGGPLTGAARAAGLDEVWALWSAAWGVANRHRSEAAAEEAAVRAATLATGHAPRPWRLR